MNKFRTNKALLLSLIGLCGLALYILACIHSPVSWSPDSSEIALLVWTGGDDVELAAIFTYNLKTGRRVVIDMVDVKENEDAGLSAPSWSPDGKWIAYYRIDPPWQLDPNSPEPVYELFSEENRMLPAFIFEAGREMIDFQFEAKITNVKLIVVDAQTKELKGERNLLWMGDDAAEQLMQFKPVWSPDSQRLFYMRMLDSIGYFASLDINSGEAVAHVFTDTGYISPSPDGKQIATVLESSLVIGNIDGSDCQYHKMPDDPNSSGETHVIQWSPDSKRVLLTTENAFLIADTQTGSVRQYSDSTAEGIGYPAFSKNAEKVLYLAAYSTGDPPNPEKSFSIRAMKLADESIEVLAFVPEIPSETDEGLGVFSVSPDGKWLLVRVMTEDEDGKTTSKLIFKDGKQTSIIETDSWLQELIPPPTTP